MITKQEWLQKNTYNDSVWYNRTTSLRKLLLYVAQAEWILFQVTLLGIDIDKRSLGAVLEAKRMLFGGADLLTLRVSVVEAHDALYEITRSLERTHGALTSPAMGQLDEQVVASICAITAAYVLQKCNDPTMDDIQFDKVIGTYLFPLGSLESKSPIAKHMKSKDVAI